MVYLTLLLSHRVAACDGGHDRQVPDLDDVRHRVPVHGGAVPHQGAERGGGDGVDLRKGGVHISALHRGPAGELKVTVELRSYTYTRSPGFNSRGTINPFLLSLYLLAAVQ